MVKKVDNFEDKSRLIQYRIYQTSPINISTAQSQIALQQTEAIPNKNEKASIYAQGNVSFEASQYLRGSVLAKANATSSSEKVDNKETQNNNHEVEYIYNEIKSIRPNLELVDVSNILGGNNFHDIVIELLKDKEIPLEIIKNIVSNFEKFLSDIEDLNVRKSVLKDLIENKNIPKEDIPNLMPHIRFDNSFDENQWREYGVSEKDIQKEKQYQLKNNNLELLKYLYKKENFDKLKIIDIITIYSDADIEKIDA